MKSILIVEDDDDVRDIVKSALERQYRILEASRCAALHALLRETIDLAIIDYRLPDGDGLQALQMLRQAEPALPAILITAYSSENLMMDAIRTHVTDYMKKPLNLMYLRRRLEELFSDHNNNHKLSSARVKEVLRGIKNHMEQNFKEDLSLETLSRRACMSKFTFCRSFKEMFGRNFTSYLNDIRIRNAAKLLKSSDHTITQIAFSVGYRNLGHFNKIFRAIYGACPKEYRKNIVYGCPSCDNESKFTQMDDSVPPCADSGLPANGSDEK